MDNPTSAVHALMHLRVHTDAAPEPKAAFLWALVVYREHSPWSVVSYSPWPWPQKVLKKTQGGLSADGIALVVITGWQLDHRLQQPW
eukprot:6343639-Amphidinium_carterae.1